MLVSVSVCRQGENAGWAAAATAGCHNTATTSLLPAEHDRARVLDGALPANLGEEGGADGPLGVRLHAARDERIQPLHHGGVAERDRDRHPVGEVQDRDVESRIGGEAGDDVRERDATERVAGAVLRVEALAVHERQRVQVHRLRPRARRVVALQRTAAADPDVDGAGSAAGGAAAGFAARAGIERQVAARPRARTLWSVFMRRLHSNVRARERLRALRAIRATIARRRSRPATCAARGAAPPT